MPSMSEKQRRFFGIVLAAKRKQLKNPSSKTSFAKVSKNISESDAQDFARKKRNGIYKSLMKEI